MGIKKYSIYCSTESAWVSSWETSEISTCPNNASHTVVSNSVRVVAENTPTENFLPSADDIALGDILSMTPTGIVKGFGDPIKQVFASRQVELVSVVAISATTFVVAYTLPHAALADQLFVIGITIPSGSSNGATMTFGTPVDTGSNAFKNLAGTFITGTTFYFVWQEYSNNGDTAKGVFGTISGTTITLGSATAFASGIQIGRLEGTLAITNMSSTLLVATYADATGKVASIAATVSGSGASSSLTFGTPVTLSIAYPLSLPNSLGMGKVDSSRFLVCFDEGGTQTPTVMCSVSGTTITVGSYRQGNNSSLVVGATGITLTYISATAQLLTFIRTIDGQSFTYAQILTIPSSGTGAATANTALKITTSPRIYEVAASVVDTSIAILTASDESAVLSFLTVSGTTLTLVAASRVASNARSLNVVPAVVSTDSVALFFVDGVYGAQGSCMICDFDGGNAVNVPTAVGSEVIGVAAQSANSGAGVKFITNGILAAWTGLTLGATYYAHGDGTVSTSAHPTDNGYIPVKLGVAISTTQINIKL